MPASISALEFVVVATGSSPVILKNERTQGAVARERELLPENLRLGDRLVLQPDGSFARQSHAWLTQIPTLAQQVLEVAEAALANVLETSPDHARQAMIVWAVTQG